MAFDIKAPSMAGVLFAEFNRQVQLRKRARKSGVLDILKAMAPRAPAPR